MLVHSRHTNCTRHMDVYIARLKRYELMHMWLVRRAAMHSSEDGHFHPGELQVHSKLGVQSIEATMRSFVRPAMPEQHRDFFCSLPFLIIAARDGAGDPWATALTGTGPPEQHGTFVMSPNSKTLSIASLPRPGDPLEGAFVAGADVGVLGIELHTRRRNRANGHIDEQQRSRSMRPNIADTTFTLAIDQSFGNCPQYITERNWRWDASPPPSGPARSAALSPEQQQWLRHADTLFLASGYRGDREAAAYGMDASHRGGDPGFVRVHDESHFSFPARSRSAVLMESTCSGYMSLTVT
jgi:uncharacterized protein